MRVKKIDIYVCLMSKTLKNTDNLASVMRLNLSKTQVVRNISNVNFSMQSPKMMKKSIFCCRFIAVRAIICGIASPKKARLFRCSKKLCFACFLHSLFTKNIRKYRLLHLN